MAGRKEIAPQDMDWILRGAPNQRLGEVYLPSPKFESPTQHLKESSDEVGGSSSLGKNDTPGELKEAEKPITESSNGLQQSPRPAKTPRLNKLPLEVLVLIAKKLLRVSDMKSLSLVSKTMCRAVSSELVKSIRIRPRTKKYAASLDISDLFARELLTKTKHLRISGPDDGYAGHACEHTRFWDKRWPVELPWEQNPQEISGFSRLTWMIMRIFDQLEVGSLKSFTWDLGNCIPWQVLGPGSYLAMAQPQLELLSLTSPKRCRREREEEFKVDLNHYRNLRQLSWINFNPRGNLFALRTVLRNNNNILTHLRIEFDSVLRSESGENTMNFTEDVNYRDEDNSEEWNSHVEDDGPEDNIPMNFFAHRVLGYQEKAKIRSPLFPALTSLYLGFISLLNAQRCLIKALNIRKLSSLTIRECQGMRSFLQAIRKTCKNLKFQSLSYQWGGEWTLITDRELTYFNTLSNVIDVKRSPAMRDLFLFAPARLPNWDDRASTITIWHLIKTSGLLIERFVFHERFVHVVQDSRQDSQMDSDHLLTPYEVSNSIKDLQKEDSAIDFNYQDNKVRCLGLVAQPRAMRRLLNSPRGMTRLEILHFRLAGRDMALDLTTKSKMQGMNLDEEDLQEMKGEKPWLFADRKPFVLVDRSRDKYIDWDNVEITGKIKTFAKVEAIAAARETDKAPLYGASHGEPSKTPADVAKERWDRADPEFMADRETLEELRHLPEDLFEFAFWIFGGWADKSDEEIEAADGNRGGQGPDWNHNGNYRGNAYLHNFHNMYENEPEYITRRLYGPRRENAPKVRDELKDEFRISDWARCHGRLTDKEGIPSLKMLAYGDFSFEGRYKTRNHILVKIPWTGPLVPRGIKIETKHMVTLPFRPIRDGDWQLQEMMDRNMDFLSACPVDFI